MKLLPRLLADEEEGDEPQSQVEVVKPEAHRHFWAWTATLAAVAAVPRLLYMFVFSNPENPGPYGDGQATVEESKQLGGWYNEPGYNRHALAVPPDRPDITYGLALYGHVEGRHLVSEMYDPFAYLPSGYRYEDHEVAVSMLVRCWLGTNDIRLIAIPAGDADLTRALQVHPDWFIDVGELPQAGWKIVGVTVRPVPAAECQAARSASP